MTVQFICDVHLGKLAKWLRMLGFDTVYDNSYSNEQLKNIAIGENRILLSRNIAFVKASLPFLLITSENSTEQLKQVVEHFHLKECIHPFSRCIVCNGELVAVTKEEIIPLLQPNTIQYFNEFWQCQSCKRIYWKGSHYQRMMKGIEEIQEE